jgi:pyruvate/2-oxoglutarate dehydrogenase complex dihydrolipoamide dehydrogenase (E3) component
VAYEFDMIVIGAGAAGLTASGFSASLGAKTALIESRRLGGECTWAGCVPSKTLLRAAKVVHSASAAARYGLPPWTPAVDFGKLMRHVHTVQDRIYEDADAPPLFEKLGVQVIEGRASFLDPHTIQVNHAGQASRRIQSRYFLIATGSAPLIPPIDEIGKVPYLTNETIFSLERLPARLTVIGGGPLGVELAQAFGRLGAKSPSDCFVGLHFTP